MFSDGELVPSKDQDCPNTVPYTDFQGSLYFHNDQNHTYNHMQGEHNKPAFTYLLEKEANLIAGIDT